ncbi:MAG: radical SAM family heme chaperone HemW [Clostridia bacterium]|nr:radical SAM family heme chaperone HemW [Clostridia bacterium]
MFSLYIHIPFCKQKCRYCAFHSAAATEPQKEQYCQALLQAIEKAEHRPCATLYFGGGTPALLGAERLARVVEKIRQTFTLLPDAELTIELNPESTTPELLSALKEMGFNRISLGVQSLNDSELTYLGRLHTAERAKEALAEIFAAGFQNVSADVMFGIPEQTEESFSATLDTLLSYPITHLSAYGLQWEEGTPLGNAPQPMEEEAEEALWLLLCQKAKAAGLEHYEISNFAKEGYASKHNTAYWRRTDYLGIGPAAHSFLNGVRYSAPEDTAAFISNPDPLQNPLPISAREAYEEAVMLGLRTKEGIPLSLLPKDFDFERHRDFSYVEQNRFILNERGFYLSNAIIQGVLQ